MSDRDDEQLGSFYMSRGRRASVPEKRRGMPVALGLVVTAAAFAAILWYTYPRGEERYAEIEVPLVKADTSAYKTAPDDPGGMEVRHRDSTIFDPLEKKAASRQTENLLPRPEEPLDKDKALGTTTAAPVKLDPSLDLKLVEAADGTEKVVETAPAETKAAETKTAAPVKKPESAPAKTAAAKPAETKPATPVVRNGVYIQLGAYSDPAGAAADWTRLKKKFPAELGNLGMRTEKVTTAKGTTLTRLQAGVLTESRAREICEKLKSKNGGGCIVVR